MNILSNALNSVGTLGYFTDLILRYTVTILLITVPLALLGAIAWLIYRKFKK